MKKTIILFALAFPFCGAFADNPTETALLNQALTALNSIAMSVERAEQQQRMAAVAAGCNGNQILRSNGSCDDCSQYHTPNGRKSLCELTPAAKEGFAKICVGLNGKVEPRRILGGLDCVLPIKTNCRSGFGEFQSQVRRGLTGNTDTITICVFD